VKGLDSSRELDFILARLHVVRLFGSKVQGPGGKQPSTIDFLTSQSRRIVWSESNKVSQRKKSTHPGEP
jgi:hypothetical protein